MTAPSTPPPVTAPPGGALAWLRSDRREPPSFLPSVHAARALEAWTAGGAALEALEAGAAAGDSATARGLAVVHATALALVPPAPGSAALRERILASAGGSARSTAAPEAAVVDLPPVVAVGLRHRARPEEGRRDAAIDRLGADVRAGDVVLEQVLERVAALVDLPLLVVSVVHGAETVHRAFRCTLPAEAPRVVPREASFCTHCVADDAPLVLADAAADPFFARHPAVSAFGLVSYCGVPLHATTPGMVGPTVLGTLCGYDVRPRDHSIGDVALLEVFARRVVAVLERRDDPRVLDAAASAAAGVDLYAAPFFADLVEVACERATTGAPASLLVGAPGARLVAAADPVLRARLVGGWMPDGRPGWLLGPVDPAVVRAAEAELTSASGGSVRAFAGP